MRASINSLVVAVAVMMGSVSLLIECSELVDSLCGIRSLGINGPPGVSGLYVGIRVLTGDGSGVSFGSGSEPWSGEDECSGDQ